MNRAGDAPICPDCGSTMIWENKHRQGKRPNYRWRCGRCRFLASAHRMTHADYRLMFDAQEGCCAICGGSEALVIDHDHSCCRAGKSCPECRRGLLCNTCNRWLGLAQDKPETLLTGFLYLTVYKSR